MPLTNKCGHAACKKRSVYCRKVRGEMERFCARHWKSDVEAKSPKSYRDTVRPVRTLARRKARPKKKKRSLNA